MTSGFRGSLFSLISTSVPGPSSRGITIMTLEVFLGKPCTATVELRNVGVAFCKCKHLREVFCPVLISPTDSFSNILYPFLPYHNRDFLGNNNYYVGTTLFTSDFEW